MAKYYSIRVISGNNEEEALENLMSENLEKMKGSIPFQTTMPTMAEFLKK